MKVLLIVCLLIWSGVVATARTVVDDVTDAVASTNWAQVTNLYDRIEWQTVSEPLKTLRQLIVAMRGLPELRVLRKEIKTKYNLLKGEQDEEIVDPIVEYPVAYRKTEYKKTPFRDTEYRGTVYRDVSYRRFSVINTVMSEVLSVDSPYSVTLYNATPFKTTRWSDSPMEVTEWSDSPWSDSPMSVTEWLDTPVDVVVTHAGDIPVWQQRYARRRDYGTNKVLPMAWAVLGIERRRLMGSDSGDYDVQLDRYNTNIVRALDRRQKLGKKKR